MKTKLYLVSSALFTALTFLMIPTCRGNVITFDDLSESGTGSFLANGYQGLNWGNFVGMNAILYAGSFPFFTNGYYYGIVSASNVAYNASGSPAEIDSRGTNFNFLSAYLTGAWNSNLNIEVQGFRGGMLLYDTNVLASATSPALFTLNYLNVDRVNFVPSGGQEAGFGASGPWFAMDNFTFEFVPEPSSLLLAAVGALLLCPLLKRKRA